MICGRKLKKENSVTCRKNDMTITLCLGHIDSCWLLTSCKLMKKNFRSALSELENGMSRNEISKSDGEENREKFCTFGVCV